MGGRRVVEALVVDCERTEGKAKRREVERSDEGEG